MAVDGGIRHRLQVNAKRTLGDKEGDALMELLPPIGWDHFATKHDLAEMERRIDLKFEAMGERIDCLRHELIGELSKAINTSITSQTRSFLLTNAGLLLSVIIFFRH